MTVVLGRWLPGVRPDLRILAKNFTATPGSRWPPLTLWPRIKARRQRSAEADALNRSASRALDDHDLTDAVRPRPCPLGDQHGEKKSHKEKKGENPAG